MGLLAQIEKQGFPFSLQPKAVWKGKDKICKTKVVRHWTLAKKGQRDLRGGIGKVGPMTTQLMQEKGCRLCYGALAGGGWTLRQSLTDCVSRESILEICKYQIPDQNTRTWKLPKLGKKHPKGFKNVPRADEGWEQ